MVLTEVDVDAEVEVEVESGTGVEPAVEAVVVLERVRLVSRPLFC